MDSYVVVLLTVVACLGAAGLALLGLSGGVDSTATALILKKSGYEVYGFFFDVIGNQVELRKRAETAARKLDIPFLHQDISKYFK